MIKNKTKKYIISFTLIINSARKNVYSNLLKAKTNMKMILICKFFFEFFNKYLNTFKKNHPGCKTYTDGFIMYAKIVMFFINSIKNDLKNFRSRNCFNFFLPVCKHFVFCRVQNLYD